MKKYIKQHLIVSGLLIFISTSALLRIADNLKIRAWEFLLITALGVGIGAFLTNLSIFLGTKSKNE
jgi:hypothetical protein